MGKQEKQEKQEKAKPGKRRQAWTQRTLERARRAAPKDKITIKPDGTLEFVPVDDNGDAPPPNPWEPDDDK